MYSCDFTIYDMIARMLFYIRKKARSCMVIPEYLSAPIKSCATNVQPASEGGH